MHCEQGSGSFADVSNASHPEMEQPESDEPVVLRRDADTVTIHWPAMAGERMRIEAATNADPEAPRRAVGMLEAGSATLRSPSRDRTYFLLAAPDGRRQITAERQLPFRGHANFRDLGGYRSADRRTIRWGRLFRSGALSGLDEQDLDLLGALGLTLVCDFRSPTERESEPHRFPEDARPEQHAVNHEQLAGALNPDAIRARIDEARFADLETDSLLVDGNASFATTHRRPFATMLGLACNTGNHPLLVNCSAGKDRTGFAAAVLLLALGIPRATIRHDYLLTHHYQREERQVRLEQIRQAAGADPAVLLPLFEARPAYIDAAFAAIDEEWGSDEAFLRTGLGMTADQLSDFRDALLV